MGIFYDLNGIVLRFLPFVVGIAVAGCTYTYLLTLPSIIQLSANQISQAYTLLSFGIAFFSMMFGSMASLFMRHIFLERKTQL